MKHLKIMMLMLILATGTAFAQDYYGDDYAEPYESFDDAYLTYDYGYESARPWLSRYNGPVYYWTHPYRDVYFVLVGPRVFVIPIYELSRIRHRLHWSLVSMNRFIHLSCFGLPYYDSYVRFNYYYNHYRRYSFNRYHNRYLRDRYRRYFHNRRSNRDYYRHRSRVLQKRHLDSRYRYRSESRVNRDHLGTRRGTSRYAPRSRDQRTDKRYRGNRYPVSSSRTIKRSRLAPKSYSEKGSSRVVRKSTISRSSSKRSTSVGRSSGSRSRSVFRSGSAKKTTRSRRK